MQLVGSRPILLINHLYWERFRHIHSLFSGINELWAQFCRTIHLRIIYIEQPLGGCIQQRACIHPVWQKVNLSVASLYFQLCIICFLFWALSAYEVPIIIMTTFKYELTCFRTDPLQQAKSQESSMLTNKWQISK